MGNQKLSTTEYKNQIKKLLDDDTVNKLLKLQKSQGLNFDEVWNRRVETLNEAGRDLETWDYKDLEKPGGVQIYTKKLIKDAKALKKAKVEAQKAEAKAAKPTDKTEENNKKRKAAVKAFKQQKATNPDANNRADVVAPAPSFHTEPPKSKPEPTKSIYEDADDLTVGNDNNQPTYVEMKRAKPVYENTGFTTANPEYESELDSASQANSGNEPIYAEPSDEDDKPEITMTTNPDYGKEGPASQANSGNEPIYAEPSDEDDKPEVNKSNKQDSNSNPNPQPRTSFTERLKNALGIKPKQEAKASTVKLAEPANGLAEAKAKKVNPPEPANGFAEAKAKKVKPPEPANGFANNPKPDVPGPVYKTGNDSRPRSASAATPARDSLQSQESRRRNTEPTGFSPSISPRAPVKKDTYATVNKNRLPPPLPPRRYKSPESEYHIGINQGKVKINTVPTTSRVNVEGLYETQERNTGARKRKPDSGPRKSPKRATARPPSTKPPTFGSAVSANDHTGHAAKLVKRFQEQAANKASPNDKNDKNNGSEGPSPATPMKPQ